MDEATWLFRSLFSWITLTDSMRSPSKTLRSSFSFDPCSRGSRSPTLIPDLDWKLGGWSVSILVLVDHASSDCPA